MSEAFRFRVEPDDGDTFEVGAGMRDTRLWEKLHRNRSLGMLSDPASMSATVLFELAYSACRRQGMVPVAMTVDQFVDAYDIEMIDPRGNELRELTPEYAEVRDRLLAEFDGLTPLQAETAALAAQGLDDEVEARDPLSTRPEA
jgi:hypothetical protein